jgi:hypothetical protein
VQKGRSGGNMNTGRDFTGPKKSAQTCIYLIDREKIEWLKVG